jgi:uncharacterized membrane protein YvbJ
MQNLAKNNPEMFCPRCGEKNELDSPEVKFCRFCGLPITESKEAVQGLTLIKRQGRRFASWGYVTLQILFCVTFLFLIPTIPSWTSAVLMIIFALSNGFFIAGSLAAENRAVPLLDRAANKQLSKPDAQRLQEANTNGPIPACVTENTTRKLR